jgi:hypothetical protein
MDLRGSITLVSGDHQVTRFRPGKQLASSVGAGGTIDGVIVSGRFEI